MLISSDDRNRVIIRNLPQAPIAFAEVFACIVGFTFWLGVRDRGQWVLLKGYKIIY